MANLTYSQLKDIFLKATYLMRGYTLTDYTNPSSQAQKLIRFAYAQENQPYQGIQDGCSYLWINYKDSEVNKPLNYSQTYNSISSSFDIVKTQTRELEIHWTFYGESAQDDAFIFRQKIYSESTKSLLDPYGIKLVLDVPECVLFYEEVNEQWWPRCDLIVNYYLTTDFEEEVPAITSAQVFLETETKEIEINVND